ncbi:MAG: transglycosylase SLT domain-containing protein [Acidobacteriia bacterium]|nr:transglycosylase SLT domain-containing protein [Terriglobia bacterium]
MNVKRTGRHVRIGVAVLMLGVACACSVTSKPTTFKHYFIPPATRVEPARFVMQEPPLGDHGLYPKQTPLQVAFAGVAKPTVEADIRSSRAEDFFRNGSELLAKAKPDAARAEFDKALEILFTADKNVAGRETLIEKYQRLVEATYRLEVEAASQGAQNQEPAFDKSPLEDIAGMTFPLEPGLEGKVKEELQATVSQLPLQLADPVLSFINYFSSPRGKRVLTYGLQRSGRYAPMIRRILDEEGVPQELIYLAQAESGFLPRAVSRKKATGMWQFVQFRGREYGLMQTPSADDRLDPEKATRAAARHLRDLFAEFGDWYLAIAAYNCGPGNVDRAIVRTGYADFWELYKRNVLPRETANYLPIIVAMTIMAKNPADYGLDGVVPDVPLEYDTIQTSAPTHLALLADVSDKPLASIREMNPAVLKMVAPSGYAVHVPKGSAKSVLAALDAIPEERRASWRVHRVGSSETIASIARRYKTTEKSIASANGSDAMEPETGDLVVIPVAYPGPVAPVAKSRKAKKTTKASVRASSRRPTPKKAAAANTPSRKPKRPSAASTKTVASARAGHPAAAANSPSRKPKRPSATSTKTVASARAGHPAAAGSR